MNHQDIPEDKGTPIDPYAEKEENIIAEGDTELEAEVVEAAVEKEDIVDEAETPNIVEPSENKQSRGFDISKSIDADTTTSEKLAKDQSINLTEKIQNLRSVLIGLGWDAQKTSEDDDEGREFDLDASAFVLNNEGRVDDDSDFVFYNNTETKNKTVRHHGDNKDGAGAGDDEIITVALDEVSLKANSIVFAVTIHEAFERMQHFGRVENAYIRVVDLDTNKEILRFNLTEDADKKDAVILGELIRNSTGWTFRSIGEMSVSGLYGIAKSYGVYVAPT